MDAMERNELYAADWDTKRSGYNSGQLSSQGIDFENVHYNVIPTAVFITHVSNESYRFNIGRSYQIMTFDAAAFIIASETFNKSLYETNSTGCSYDRIHFFSPPSPRRLEYYLVAYFSHLVQLSRNISQRYKFIETGNTLKRLCLNIEKTKKKKKKLSALL
jgi:hypothetical protein